MSNYAFFRLYCQENLPGQESGFSLPKEEFLPFLPGSGLD
jgi:hypothetical protein